jgi:hypothetical protein
MSVHAKMEPTSCSSEQQQQQQQQNYSKSILINLESNKFCNAGTIIANNDQTIS